MLGADFLYVSGELLDINRGRPKPVRHRFWAHRQNWRVERDDGVTFIDGDSGSVTIVHGRVRERGPRHGPGFNLAERMLRPQYASIWGRPGDDWRLSDNIDPVSSQQPTLARIELLGSPERFSERGRAEVDPDTGRLWRLETPGYTWELLTLSEDADADPEHLFRLPPNVAL